ncbi:hypothetical protein ACFV2U_11520 [Streptomyces sp. NPDC059697]|uniref:hypothetical protein n=1 Tax=Streptomyces sp. NPDC059697 TaxID=3346912 RepID=UPI00369149B9
MISQVGAALLVETVRRCGPDYLRARRAMTAPGNVGLPDDGSRREPGLRRDEVALLAGVITIVGALRLDNSAATHLFRLGPLMWTGRFVTVPFFAEHMPPWRRRTWLLFARSNARIRSSWTVLTASLPLRDRAPSRATRPYARCRCGGGARRRPGTSAQRLAVAGRTTFLLLGVLPRRAGKPRLAVHLGIAVNVQRADPG